MIEIRRPTERRVLPVQFTQPPIGDPGELTITD